MNSSNGSDAPQVPQLLPDYQWKNGMHLTLVSPIRHQRYEIFMEDPLFIETAMDLPLVTRQGPRLECLLHDFARCLNCTEERRHSRLRSSMDRTDRGASSASAAAVGSHEPRSEGMQCQASSSDCLATPNLPRPTTVVETLAKIIHTDSNLFFALASETYELSRDPLGERKFNIWLRDGHCRGFLIFVHVFAFVFCSKVRSSADSLPSFADMKPEHLIRFRRLICDSFHLSMDDPIAGSVSESNLEAKWINDNIKCDAYFFPHRQTPTTMQHPRDATLSYVPVRRGKLTEYSVDAKANEITTFGLSEGFLKNPTWEPDDSTSFCRVCGRAFKSGLHLLGCRAHHCRSCGQRLCEMCITKKAHRSFAKLTKPGRRDETEVRLVCNRCYARYCTLEQLRYLGALFAMAGLDFRHLSLCRTVNAQWRHAAELCMSEYRLLLHTCNPDLHSVLTPVGVLLLNSVPLIVHPVQHTTFSKDAFAIHPEAALLLLQYIATENLWSLPAAEEFVCAFSKSSLGESLRFSHWHFFCTTFCRLMQPAYFSMKAIEWLGWSPSDCSYAQRAMLCLAEKHLLANCPTSSTLGSGSGDTAAITPSISTELEVTTIWLLDLLYRDAITTGVTPERRYQAVLEKSLPVLARSSRHLALMMLLSFQSFGHSIHAPFSMTAVTKPAWVDVQLTGLWRTRILEEVRAVGGKQAYEVVTHTVNFFTQFDTFCKQARDVGRESVVGWVRYYCGHALPRGSSLAFGDFLDLPTAICHPFKPCITLRSVSISRVHVMTSSAKPIWLTFSTYSSAEANESEGRSMTSIQDTLWSFLYKRENVERDQLMCISSRLLQDLLRGEIGQAQLADYSVLPLSRHSGLIEKTDGVVLSNLPCGGVGGIVSYLEQRQLVNIPAHRNFLASAKLFLLLSYIFSIGDRHQGNVVLSPYGAILHIDFGLIFSEKTLVEKLAGTTIRIDAQFLAAVAACQNLGIDGSLAREGATGNLFVPPTTLRNDEAFFLEAARWFTSVRPFAAIFYHLWLYAVHRGTLSFDEKRLSEVLNTLFDRSVSQTSSEANFVKTLMQSINVCRMKDATHTGAQALRFYSEQMSRKMRQGGDWVARMMGTWPSGWKV